MFIDTRVGILKVIHKLGLLNKILFESKSAWCKIFHFSYVRIQEYLTTYYISLLPNREILWLLYGTLWNRDCLNVWVLYVGITGGKSSIFKCFLSGSQPYGTLHI